MFQNAKTEVSLAYTSRYLLLIFGMDTGKGTRCLLDAGEFVGSNSLAVVHERNTSIFDIHESFYGGCFPIDTCQSVK